ncbi:SNF2-related protein [Actinosynnema sp. NPDC023587]|uniref:SNF2-related protein n=1 Tax=Actinosynnema sp. NPDC023587 TaxID=3154695 RepID=UPI0033FA4E0E
MSIGEVGSATKPAVGFAAGSTVVIRDEEWLVRSCEAVGDGWMLSCLGTSELVRDVEATFYTELEEGVTHLDPERARLVADVSPGFRRTRLWLESVLRKTPLPLHEPRLAVCHRMLADDLLYQRRAVAQALSSEVLRPRLLLADAVGLGKTLEIGMILAELARRGRADRILVVTPRHVLEQMQHELWTRFAIPLVRLDSDGIQRVRQTLPSTRNPFTFFKRVIVSVDTLKSARYRAHLEKHRWDVVVIDESHNLSNSSTQNNKLAKVLAPNTDALLLASATPHNGKSESFAELVKLLDPTAIVDVRDYSVKDISHLFVRRHRHSPDVAAVVGQRWAERLEPEVLAVDANAAEEAVFAELADIWLYPDGGSAPVSGKGSSLFPWTLVKAFLSSPAALVETVQARLKRLPADAKRERAALDRLLDLARRARESSKLDALVKHLTTIGVKPGSNERVVLFSERLATLDWLRTELPARLKMPASAFRVLHGSLPDTEQMAVVDEFKRADTPVRVLITGDVASEGVNLHAQCHHLVHVDIPWSLIRIEQRNGRIDRYGQEHPPRIVALATISAHERLSGDIRVLAKLLAKEHVAHKALGDAASLMKLHDEDAEEEAVRRAIAEGRDLDEVIPDPSQDEADWDFDELFADAGEEVPDSPEVIADYDLFRSDLDFLREAVFEAYDDSPARSPGSGGIAWAEHPDEGTVEFVPPGDLMGRLAALPQSYLAERRIRERFVLAVDKAVGQAELARARENVGSTTSWPQAHFLGPLHPVLDWAVDKALSRFGRNEVPVVTGAVDSPVVIGLGTLSNGRGQVVLRSLIGLTFYDEDAPPYIEQEDEVRELLRRAGLRDGGINSGHPVDIEKCQPLIPKAIEAMRGYMDMVKGQRALLVQDPLVRAAHRIRQWRKESEQLALDLAPVRANAVKRSVERHGKQALDLVTELSARKDPMLRVLTIIVPEKPDVEESAR